MRGINFHYLLRRIAGRPTCEKHPTARLGASARIMNIGTSSSLITIGERSIVEGDLLTFAHGGQITIGHSCYIGVGTRIWSALRIEIGDRVLISHNVNIFDNLTHPINPALRHKHFNDIFDIGHPKEIDLGERSVRIEDDAWISAGASVLRGVTVGTGAVVGAGAVVTRDVEPFSIVAGNPARFIRFLTAEERSAPAARADGPL